MRSAMMLLAAALPLVGCLEIPDTFESGGCTLIGCFPETGIIVTFDEALVGEVWVDFVAEGRGVGGGCRNEPASSVDPSAFTITELGPRTPAGTERQPEAFVTCGPFDARLAGWRPPAVTVSIEEADAIQETSYDGLSYVVSQPNGPECEPTCEVANVAFAADLSDGGGPNGGD